ncbi:LCP family protein [Labedaea rhizosphaerae]|uniref:LytR family transcriptional attenuator n=1 Tax=Labedaea rhizosphaerae TaxID=598644 RepID=A0A4R6RYJ5_LABRH|nr:LCP family protein [Labedaea rhizosphaerae]TDP92190.1 LytR family transcriptional attenuator [Labedaea rhizosphaerae]
MRGLKLVVAAGLAAVTVACGAQNTPGAAPAAGPDAGVAPAADVNILVVGMDTRPGIEGSRPDTIAVVHVPKSGDSAAVVSLPRDLEVNADGFGRTRLNAVYPLALAAEKRKAPNLPQLQQVQKAQEDFVAVVQKVTGVRIDHYAQADMQGFVAMTKLVGGVSVCLNAAQHDPMSGANFPAGAQKVQGDTALAFVRQRHNLPNGDLDRIRRQQVFLAGLIDTVASSGTLSSPVKVRALLGAVRKYVVLDQRWDLISFANQVRDLTSYDVRIGTVPITGTTALGWLTADPAKVKSFIHGYFAPKPAGHGDSRTKPRTPGSIAPVCVN